MGKRLFAAIKFHPDKIFLDQLHQLQMQLVHERIKWVEEQNIHITLKFFGETDERKIPEIGGVLKKVADGNPAFGFRLRSIGVFGSKYDPRVIWVGIEPYDRLVKLMKELHAELKAIGYEPDRQNLIPHLTLGRIKGIKDKQLFQRTIEKFREIETPEKLATEIILYESILKSDGPVYLVQGTFPFQK
jgi:2'-5' RNA ligase